jgi:1-acyl-sn-glycerol-3-phosphate acyltransferase
MVVKFILFLTRIAAYFFYPEKELIGMKRLETNKPLLVCANHGNAFIDAMLIMAFSKRKYHVLVRSDVFTAKWSNWLLQKWQLIPVYRLRDGIGQLDKNKEIFDKCIKIFEDNGAIIVFPEANCFLEKKLRKIHKGSARLAFQAEESANFKLGLSIVGVGINYERMRLFGGKIWLSVSNPFGIAHLKNNYQLDKNEALLEVTKQIAADIKVNMVELANAKQEYLWERVLAWTKTSKSFKYAMTVAENIRLETEELQDVLKSAVHQFENKLRKIGINRKWLMQHQAISQSKLGLLVFLRLIDLLFLFPIFLLGLLCHAIPFYLPLAVATAIFKKDREYDASINITGSVVLLLFLYIIYAFIIYAYLPSIILVGFALLTLLLSGLVAFHYRRNWIALTSAIHYWKLKNIEKTELTAQLNLIAEELAQF